MKYCYKCKTTKDINEFYNNKSKKDGLCSECKKCCINYNKKYVQTEKGKLAKRKSSFNRFKQRVQN